MEDVVTVGIVATVVSWVTTSWRKRSSSNDLPNKEVTLRHALSLAVARVIGARATWEFAGNISPPTRMTKTQCPQFWYKGVVLVAGLGILQQRLIAKYTSLEDRVEATI